MIQEKKMKNNIKNIVILHIVILLFSAISIASKLASGADFLSTKFIVFYGIVLLGLFVYAIAWQQIIKRIPLVTAYANKAVTVIWGLIYGRLFFGEKITLRKIIGAVIIVSGVCLIVTADGKEEEK